jgi:hypothetical protein
MTSKELTRQVFLSYASRDRELAGEIAKALEQVGIRSWHSEQIRPGTAWKTEISRALEESDSMIAILNPHSFSSSHVRNELEYGLFDERYKHRLLPVLIGSEDSEAFERIPWILTKLQFFTISTREPPRHNAKMVVDAFLSLLESSGGKR